MSEARGRKSAKYFAKQNGTLHVMKYGGPFTLYHMYVPSELYLWSLTACLLKPNAETLKRFDVSINNEYLCPR